MGGGSNAGDQARQDEAKRQMNMAQGMNSINNSFAGFDPKFYQGRADAYSAYAMPQYSRQYQDTRNQGLFAMGNQGMLQSGAAQERGNALGLEAQTQRQNITDTGTKQAQDLRRTVEGQRSSLVGQLAASQDPVSTGQSALATAQAYQAPSTYAPVQGLFNQFQNTWLARQYANQGGAPMSPYSQFSTMPKQDTSYQPAPQRITQ